MRKKIPLTRRQAEVLEFIKAFAAEHGYAPTLEEIGSHLGVNRVTIFEHVKALESKGWIRSRKHFSRSITLTGDEDETPRIPILGRIAAGGPIEAVEDRETFDVEEFFPTNRECFMLRVCGESMIEDQIRDGDLVLVEARKTAQPGETVVALIDGEEVTLKRFQPQGRKIRLEPRNAAMEPIVVDSDRVQIQGVVIGVLRRYS